MKEWTSDNWFIIVIGFFSLFLGVSSVYDEYFQKGVIVQAEPICDLSGLKLKSITLTGDRDDFVVMGIKEHLYRRGVTIDQENGLEIVGSVLWPEVASVEIIGKPFASTVTGPGSYALGEAIVDNLCACKDRVLPPQSAEE